MPVNNLARLTVATGLLLTELAPTTAAQTIDPSPNSDQDSVSITAESSRGKLSEVAQSSPSDPARMAQPERLGHAESRSQDPPVTMAAVVLAAAPLQDRASIQSVDLQSPSANESTLKSTDASATVNDATVARRADAIAVSTQTENRVVSTRANDLIIPGKAKDLELPNPGTIAQSNTQPKAISQPEMLPIRSAQSLSSPLSSSTDQTSSAASSTPLQISNPRPTQTAQKTVSDLDSSPPIIQSQFGADFTSGAGIGYSSSFTGIKAFVPLAQQPGRNITYLQGQLFLSTAGGNPSANLIVGHRIYDPKSDRIYGGYLAFDHRDTGNNGFNQIGLGLETLGKAWDVRANAYLPVGNTRQLASENINNTVTAFSNPFFQSNYLAINRTIQQDIQRRFEAAAGGFDLEAGGKIASLGDFGDLRAYGGLYYFKPSGNDGIVGARVRLEAHPTENLQIGLGLSTDNTFGTNLTFNVGYTFPSASRPSRNSLKQPLLARLGDLVNRNANIVIDNQTETSSATIQDTRLITNPATGQPWQFRHVNLGIGTGNGTFENPTGTVAAALGVAQPDDIVYVQPGTNPGIPAFTIPNGVQVLSTGPIQRINTVELGTLQLPGSGAGTLPTVLGTVTMGNRTTLSGFAISTATGPGITGSNISEVTVRDNAIANTAAQGIAFNNVQGSVTVIDNTIRQSGSEGFLLTNNQGQVDLLLARNQIANNGATKVSGSGVKVDLRNTATGTVTIEDNSITNNRLNGVEIDLEKTTQGTFNLNRNTISGNQLNGVAILESDTSAGQFNLDGNTIANNQLKGFQAVLSNLTTGTINLTNSTISNNQDDGFYLQTSDQAKGRATLLNNAIANNANYGIFTEANGTSQLRILVGSTTVTGNGISGVSINTNDNANTAAALRSNTVTGNALGDVEAFTTAPGATSCLQPLTNTIGNLFLDDSFGGQIAVETGSLPTNTITSSTLTFWSGTTVPAGACGF